MRARCLVLAGLAFFSPVFLFGTAYVQDKGHTCIATQYLHYCTEHFWNSSGKRKSAFNDFNKYEVNVYLEHGLTGCDTITAKAVWNKVDESLNGTSFGFDEIKLGWKRFLGVYRSHILSTHITSIIPAETEYDPGFRYGRFGAEADLLASRPFCLWKKPAWYDLKLGYRWYEGFPSDQIRSSAVVNWFPFSRIGFRAGAYLEYGVFNGKRRKNASLILLNPNYRLLKAEMKAYYKIFNYGAIYAGYRKHLWGRNVGTGGGVIAGATLNF